MKHILISIFTLSILLAGNTDTQEGKALYIDAQCQKCHLQGNKFDPNSINKKGLHPKVTDSQSLQKWIANCDSFFSVGWFPEEQKSVAEYLDGVYYHH